MLVEVRMEAQGKSQFLSRLRLLHFMIRRQLSLLADKTRNQAEVVGS